jgi:hypothetical protein
LTAEEELARVHDYIGAAGRRRARAIAEAEAANADLRKLAPRARDLGATVQEIADEYGVSRAGIYVIIEGARDHADTP